jgi:hypothetical protein
MKGFVGQSREENLVVAAFGGMKVTLEIKVFYYIFNNSSDWSIFVFG